MDLTFDMGSSQQPLGHAILYFHGRDDRRVAATYMLVLPIKMDIGKYIPPLLASQFGAVPTEGLTTFAAPPMPEEVQDVAELERLARFRNEDLVYGGILDLSDVGVAIQETNEAVQAYARLYEAYRKTQPELVAASEDDSAGGDVQRVVYQLLSERDRLGEISRMVGTVRFALDRDDQELAKETDASLEALQELLPARYWVDRVRSAAHDMSDAGAALAQLYMERCYKLLDEELDAVRELERRIAEAEGRPT